MRQSSGEGVVRRNGCPKGCFWRVRFFSAPLKFVLKNTCEVLKILRGQSRKRTLQKHPFGQPFLRTTPSAAPLARPQEVLWAKGAKVSQESFAPPKPCFASVQPLLHQCKSRVLHWCNPFLHQCKAGLWRPWSKTPFAPSPNHFWEIAIFGPPFQDLGVASLVS